MKNVHSFTVHLEGDDASLVEAQVVQLHLGMSLWTVFNEIYDLKLDGRLRTEMLIVRLPVEQDWDPNEFETRSSERAQSLFATPEGEKSETFNRVRDRSVHILTSHEGHHFLSRNISPHWTEDPLATYHIEAARAIAAIQIAEFEHILDRSRAVLTSPSGSTFRAPSGRLLRSFVRVGNIQYNRDAIDAAFFWMLPHLVGVGAILTDTWSISSIALNVAKLCASYFGGPPRPVEMLPSYHDGSEAAQVRTRAVLERLNSDHMSSHSEFDTMLCMISATQTGSLTTHLQRIFESSRLSLQPRFLALFALGPTNIPSLHDLSIDPRFALLEEQNDRTSEPVVIDPQVYFPLQFKDTVIEVDKAIADRSRPFFDRYVGQGLITVHRTHEEGTGRPRHHAIHLATERLVNVPAFIASYEAVLASLPSAPKIIVCPPHAPGRALAESAAAYYRQAGHGCTVYAHPNLYLQPVLRTEEDNALRAFLRSAAEDDALLVVDDVCITGTRLSQYQRYIRTEGYVGRIYYVIGIARPAKMEIWSNLQRYLGFRGAGRPRHEVRCVDTVLLPDWRDEDCPWCREKRLYERWMSVEPKSTSISNRLDYLSKTSTSGISDELFLVFPGLPSMKLGPFSLFTSDRANQAEVFAAVAAALQHLRTTAPTDRPPLGPRRFPVSTVLNHNDYLCSKWTDSILRATFLRAASAEELTYADPNTERQRLQSLADLLTQKADGEHDVALEVLLAANLGKCKVGATDEVARQLQDFGAGDAASYLLQQLPNSDQRA